MSEPATRIFPLLIAKKNEENVLRKLRELKAFSEKTAQRPKLTRGERKAVESLKKQKKIKGTKDGLLYIPKESDKEV